MPARPDIEVVPDAPTQQQTRRNHEQTAVGAPRRVLDPAHDENVRSGVGSYSWYEPIPAVQFPPWLTFVEDPIGSHLVHFEVDAWKPEHPVGSNRFTLIACGQTLI